MGWWRESGHFIQRKKKVKNKKIKKSKKPPQRQKILGRTTLPENLSFDKGWQGLKQAVSNIIILKRRQEELVSSLYAHLAFQRIRPSESCPLDKMCCRAASDKLQRRDKQMWLWALAFGKNAHCQLEKYKPGQGISCTEMKWVCGVTGGAIGANLALCELSLLDPNHPLFPFIPCQYVSTY